MPGISKINHNGKEILFVDYKGVKDEDEMIHVLHDAQNLIVKEGKEYLQLVDITDAYATPKYMAEAKKVAKETPQVAKKRAIVGIHSAGRRILLEAYNLVISKGSGLKPFKNLEEAKDWLAQ
jgi:hypothetical protein